MVAFLIGLSGPLKDLTVRLEEGEQWVLGRDPDVAQIVLEDPMVSRRHAILHLKEGKFELENLSEVNPVLHNQTEITEPTIIEEGDHVQIGSTDFLFSLREPEVKIEEELPPQEEVFEEMPEFGIAEMPFAPKTRWMLKVISGPNAGAEFALPTNEAKIIGKDPSSCDIIFQDLSVSRQHARISLEADNKIFIEDLKSKNGTIVNGELLSEKKEIHSQDLIALGTTSFLVIDREQARETIISPPPMAKPKEKIAKAEDVEEEAPEDWHDMFIPTKHLVIAGAFAVCVIALFMASFFLLKSTPIQIVTVDQQKQIEKTLDHYPDVEFSYNPASRTIFLVGHVLTDVEKLELLYGLQGLGYIENYEDNIVIDELVWENFNALLATNSDWAGVSVHSIKPGQFVITGYLDNLDQWQSLMDYVNLHFPYLDKIQRQVVVESNLAMEIESILLQRGLANVAFELSNGQVVLVGRVGEPRKSDLNNTVNMLKALPGVRMVKNFVVVTGEETAFIDITSQYQVNGSLMRNNRGNFVVINGRILGEGNTLDEMHIMAVTSNAVYLEKDGIKFQINYNPQ